MSDKLGKHEQCPPARAVRRSDGRRETRTDGHIHDEAHLPRAVRRSDGRREMRTDGHIHDEAQPPRTVGSLVPSPKTK